MRRIPKKEGAAVVPQGAVKPDLSRDGKGNLITRQEREYELITPLFGGGVKPGKNDPLTPISGKAIRGHLRFWWRATRGGQFGDGDEGLQKMKKREAEIWGAASTPSSPSASRVQISVKIAESEKGKEAQPFKVEQKRGPDGRPEFYPDGTPKPRLVSQENVAPSYASFPLQPAANETKVGTTTKTVRKGVIFTLGISYAKSLEEEIKSALWAWETFGGIGARTRRGFGALRLISERVNGNLQNVGSLGKTEPEVIDEIKRKLKERVVEGTWPDDVPHLSQSSVFEITDFRSSALEVWQHLIDNLKRYRQQRNRGKSPNRPGRSKWPEPEQIRRLTRQRNPKHSPDPNLLKLEKFPRAAFGLPIIFQFNPSDYNRRDPYDPKSDPRKTMLRLKEHDRLASPLVLRPLSVSPTKCVGIALILDGTGFPNRLDLTLQNAEKNDESEIQTGLRADLNPNEAALIKESGSSESLLGNNKDVLYGFLDFLEP